MLDQRLRAAEAHGKGRELDGLHEPEPRAVAALQLEREHPAEPVHLPAGKPVLLKGPEPGVVDLRDRTVAVEVLRERARATVLPLDPQREGLDSPAHEEGLERSDRRP